MPSISPFQHLGDPVSSRQWLSDSLGTASFIVWLFAQSPQLYENYKNKSCDGLSVVFLVQWMLGDVTNLIGSVLTHQLPFQIAIATYFCCIDACILVQYGYYWRKQASARRKQARLARRIHHRSRTMDIRSDGHYLASVGGDEMPQLGDPLRRRDREVSVQSRVSGPYSTGEPSTSRTWQSFRDRSIRPSDSPSDARPRSARRALTMGPDRNYRALGEAARSVAQLANETEVKLAESRARRKWAWSLAKLKASGKYVRREDLPGGNQENWPDHMSASVSASSASSQLSDDGAHGFGFASTPNIGRDHQANPSSPFSHRGRGMTRMAGIVEAAVNAQHTGNTVSVPSSPVRTRSSTDRPSVSRSSTRGSLASLSSKPPGLILLGVAALFTLHRRSETGLSPSSMGDVVTRGAPAHQPRVLFDPVPPTEVSFDDVQTQPYLFFPRSTTAWQGGDRIVTSEEGGSPYPPPPSWDRVVGRFSAWSCTVLYITSRMPQIWTNMQRRSVQGLSILLFVAAATGNLLYTFSILVNPQAQSPPRSPMQRRTYLMESLPFLLGSGGTLIFDAIIVAQWLAWRGKPPELGLDLRASDLPSANVFGGRGRSRKTSTQSRWHSLERQSLL